MTTAPTRSNVTVLKQVVNLIPRPIVNSAAREAGVDLKARVFTPFSHLVTMLFARPAHAIGLNDVCDSMRHKAAALMRFGVRGPSRNNLSHANRTRKAEFIEKVFWRTPGHLQNISPGFATGRQGKGLLRRFRVRIHAVDSTVIQLFANCMDRAKHRRRKEAAKMHLRPGLHSFLPGYAVVDGARRNDASRAREVCAGLKDGEPSGAR